MPLGKESNSSPLGFLCEKEFDKSQTLSQITCCCSFWSGKFYINISLVVSESFKLFWLPHAPPNSAILPLLTLFGNVAHKCSINLDYLRIIIIIILKIKLPLVTSIHGLHLSMHHGLSPSNLLKLWGMSHKSDSRAQNVSLSDSRAQNVPLSDGGTRSVLLSDSGTWHAQHHHQQKNAHQIAPVN